MERKLTRKVKVGSVYVGGDSSVSIQSMTNTDTRNVEATLDQIRALHIAGCEIIRCAVPDMKAAEAIKEICLGSPIPVVADIHFDYRLALKCVENGIKVSKEYEFSKRGKNGYVKYPVVTKPVDNNGSTGISICQNLQELEKGYKKGMDNSKIRRIGR